MYCLRTCALPRIYLVCCCFFSERSRNRLHAPTLLFYPTRRCSRFTFCSQTNASYFNLQKSTPFSFPLALPKLQSNPPNTFPPLFSLSADCYLFQPLPLSVPTSFASCVLSHGLINPVAPTAFVSSNVVYLPLPPSDGDSDTDSELEDRVDGVKSWLSKNKGSAKNLSDDGSLKSSRSVQCPEFLLEPSFYH